MKMLGVAVLLFAAAIGCGHAGPSTRAFRGPDGDIWYAVRCGKRHEECYQEAGNYCPRGYVVGGDQVENSGTVITSGAGVTTVHPITNGVLYMRCKRPEEIDPVRIIPG